MSLSIEKCNLQHPDPNKITVGELRWSPGDMGIEGNDEYILPLSDIHFELLPPNERDSICKISESDGPIKYRMSKVAYSILRTQLNPKDAPVSIPASVAKEYQAALERYASEEPPFLEDITPNLNAHVFTEIRLSPVEVAIIRFAMGDSLIAEGSLLRRVRNPLDGRSEKGLYRYAFSVKMTPTQYDKIDYALYNFLGSDQVPSVVNFRIDRLRVEIRSLKTQYLRKDQVSWPVLIPDNYLSPDPKVAASERLKLMNIDKDRGPVGYREIDTDDYVLFALPLYPEGRNLFRYILASEDTPDEPLLVRYHPDSVGDTSAPELYYIKRGIRLESSSDVVYDPWNQLVFGLEALKAQLEENRADPAHIRRADRLVNEAKRLHEKCKQESMGYQLVHGLPVAMAFVGSHAIPTVTVVGLLYLARRYFKKGPPKGPPTGGGRRPRRPRRRRLYRGNRPRKPRVSARNRSPVEGNSNCDWACETVKEWKRVRNQAFDIADAIRAGKEVTKAGIVITAEALSAFERLVNLKSDLFFFDSEVTHLHDLFHYGTKNASPFDMYMREMGYESRLGFTGPNNTEVLIAGGVLMPAGAAIAAGVVRGAAQGIGWGELIVAGAAF